MRITHQLIRIFCIPLDSSSNAFLEAYAWLPAERVFYPIGIERIAAIMARAIGDELDLISIGLSAATRPELVEYRTDLFDDFYIRALRVTADVVVGSRFALPGS